MSTAIEPTRRGRAAIPPRTVSALARLYDELERTLYPVDQEHNDAGFAGLRIYFAAALGAFSAGLSIFLIVIVLNLLFHYQP